MEKLFLKYSGVITKCKICNKNLIIDINNNSDDSLNKGCRNHHTIELLGYQLTQNKNQIFITSLLSYPNLKYYIKSNQHWSHQLKHSLFIQTILLVNSKIYKDKIIKLQNLNIKLYEHILNKNKEYKTGYDSKEIVLNEKGKYIKFDYSRNLIELGVTLENITDLSFQFQIYK